MTLRSDGAAPPPSPGPSGRGNIVAFAAIVLLAVVMVFIISAIQKHNAVQNCLDSGRRDCVPVSTD